MSIIDSNWHCEVNLLLKELMSQVENQQQCFEIFLSRLQALVSECTTENIANDTVIVPLLKCADNLMQALSQQLDQHTFENFDRLSLLAKTLAILRNLVGLCSVNENSARHVEAILILPSIGCFDRLFVYLDYLIPHLDHCLTVNQSSSQLQYSVQVMVTLTRVLQLMCNLINLYYGHNTHNRCINVQSRLQMFFQSDHLGFLLGLDQRKQLNESTNDLVKLNFAFSALCYCCLKHNHELLESILTESRLDLWQHFLRHVNNETSEWSLWCIFIAFKEDYFLKNLFEHCNRDHQLLLLTVLDEYIKEQLKEITTTNNRSLGKILPDSSILYMVQTFQSQVSPLTNADIECCGELHWLKMVCLLCSTLLQLVGVDYYCKLLQHDHSLLVTLVDLLKSMQILAKTKPDSIFGARSQLRDLEQTDEKCDDHPIFGFKRDLVGLIANLIYRNYDAQEYLRTSEGLAALLDCAKLDARNPFIMQWAILAIRNALENNQANQQLVTQMQKHGILQDDLISRINRPS